ncbi:uncharacterized protein F4807DRAFT_388536 [Annulohypoxylon truncatum]|uniref:uncharacterized protein n=1 Tax=Annulohypoxylon truncatum TaxID=327061 RepID=UPI002007B84B|nr:uncharacterized protein F4807DRAFT_388536 [Annulohypoxylon truncatum]KAI1212134.1 hypothetical protein F4807DRAFT_388536 [Annulohypoxylon truncatum]
MRHSIATVLCGTRGGGLGECRVRHIGPNQANDIPEPSSEPPDIRGLNQLQANRETWLNGDAIEKSISSYHEALPRQTRKIIHIADTSIRGIFHRNDRDFRRLLEGRNNRFYRGFMATEYTLWPCNYEDVHWELVVIHKGRSDANSEKWDQILQVAVIDHWKDDGARARNQMITTRLRQLFDAMGFLIADGCERAVWTPWQKDSWSCGPRVFWSAKHMMDRIQESVAASRGYDEQLWAPLPGWFNADQVRWEMIGLNAYEAVKAMDYRARIGIELVARVLDKTGNLRDAGDVMRPPDRGAGGPGGPSGSSGKQSKKPPNLPKKSGQESDDDDLIMLSPKTPKKSRQENDDDDVIEISPEVPARREVPIPIPNERRVAPSFPVQQGDPSTERRETPNDTNVWPRNTEGQPPQLSAPKRRRRTSAPEESTKFLKSNDGSKGAGPGPKKS